PLLGRVVLSRVVLALAAPGVDLAPRLVALAGEAPAVVVVLHHGYPSPPGSGLPEGPEHLSPEGANRLAFRGRHRSWTVLLVRGERLVDEPDQLHRGLRHRIALERLGRDRRRGGAICVLENGVQLERQLAEDPPTFVREPPLVKGAEEGILPVLERIVQPVPGAAVHRQPGTDSLDVSRVRTGRSGRTRCRRLRRPRPRDGRPLLENEPRRGGRIPQSEEVLEQPAGDVRVRETRRFGKKRGDDLVRFRALDPARAEPAQDLVRRQRRAGDGEQLGQDVRALEAAGELQRLTPAAVTPSHRRLPGPGGGGTRCRARPAARAFLARRPGPTRAR